MTTLRGAFFGLIITLFFLAEAFAGQLTLAVIQYTDARDADSLAAGFAGVDLAEVTNSDQVESRDSSIRGGRVLFAQSIPVGNSTSISSSTRLGALRADVSGRFNQPTVQAEIVIQDGVNVGIRKFSRSVYAGSGRLSGTTPAIISIRESSGRSQTAVKGQAKLTTYNFTTLMVAQWTK